jgi:hypothetical protein
MFLSSFVKPLSAGITELEALILVARKKKLLTISREES